MPIKKRNVRKRLLAEKQPKKRQRPAKKLLDPKSVLVNLIRDLCYRYGLAMARFEFKGKMPKPSIDEFRERIVHHMNLMERSLRIKLSENVGRSFEEAEEMLGTRLKLDVEKIRNGVNTEVETIYDSLK